MIKISINGTVIHLDVLGLTNTQNIILNHKGNINVISKPGDGASFFIKFDFDTTK
ncbi:MAG: hypothetical protein ABI741_14150 [Ferruginibacter sp.]